MPGTPFTVAAPVLLRRCHRRLCHHGAGEHFPASAAFLVSAISPATPVTRRLGGHPRRFDQLDRLLDEHAWIVIPFIRVVPVPLRA